jgi:hypothetical protein
MILPNAWSEDEDNYRLQIYSSTTVGKHSKSFKTITEHYLALVAITVTILLNISTSMNPISYLGVTSVFKNNIVVHINQLHVEGSEYMNHTG